MDEGLSSSVRRLNVQGLEPSPILSRPTDLGNSGRASAALIHHRRQRLDVHIVQAAADGLCG
ncbi:MAG: hypothetical protein RMN24_15640, partial [Anaerolineae bacterium]|nr:hypothetical protein [Anaerolineae bacterium]